MSPLRLWFNQGTFQIHQAFQKFVWNIIAHHSSNNHNFTITIINSVWSQNPAPNGDDLKASFINWGDHRIGIAIIFRFLLKSSCWFASSWLKGGKGPLVWDSGIENSFKEMGQAGQQRTKQKKICNKPLGTEWNCTSQSGGISGLCSNQK